MPIRFIKVVHLVQYEFAHLVRLLVVHTGQRLMDTGRIKVNGLAISN